MMDVEEQTYQEVVYILREDGTVEEKFTLPERVEEVVAENFNQNETVVTVTELIAPPNNSKSSNNFSGVTLVNSRGELSTISSSMFEGSGMETQLIHFNGLEQLNGSNNNSTTIINQVPQQFMELDESVLNSDNINIYELDEGSDNIQLYSSPESPNKYIISPMNTINLSNSNNIVFSSNNTRPAPTPTYSFSLPRTYAKNPNISKARSTAAPKGQGVTQLLLAHEVSSALDDSMPLCTITNARSVTAEELDWINNPDDRDEFMEESEPEIITYDSVEVTTTVDVIENAYLDLITLPPFTSSIQAENVIEMIDEFPGITQQIITEQELKQEHSTENEVKQDCPALEEPEAKLQDLAPVKGKGKKSERKRRKKTWFWNSLDEGDELLRNFKKRPHESKKWMCAVCYTWCNEKSELDNHFREKHFKTTKFQKCRFCNKKFLARFICLRHEKTHEHELKLPLKVYCAPPGKPTTSFFKKIRKPAPFSQGYTAHLLNLTKKQRQFYQCSDCDLSFSTEEYAREHYELNHAVQECIYCNQMFDNSIKLEQHQIEIHDHHYLKSFPNDYWSLQELLVLEDEGKRDDIVVSRVEFLHSYALNADLEPKERRNYYNYLRRMKNFESTETRNVKSNSKFKFIRKKAMMARPTTVQGKPGDENELPSPPTVKSESAYECQICYQPFSNDAEFSEHIKSKHSYEVKPKPFPCNFCDKKFATHSNRKEHERIHTNEKNYVCPFCNKGFIQISNLKKHIATHKDQNLKCSTCDKQFVTKNSLVLHQRAHAADRKFRCNLCDRAYNYASLLKRHMRIHTGECPYECDICFQPFHELVSLHYHRKKIHTGERPHKCSTCEKAFILSSDLKKHLSVHNKTESNITTPHSAKSGRLKRSKRSIEQNSIITESEANEETALPKTKGEAVVAKTEMNETVHTIEEVEKAST